VLQVKEAIPSVEERTYRKGQLLVEQGKVPEGFFLILQGTCELVLLNLEQHSGNGAANGPGGAAGGAAGGLGLLRAGTGVVLPAVKKESDMDFAAELSGSTSDDDEEEEDEEEEDAVQQQCPGQQGSITLAHGSYSPLAQSFNWSGRFSRADSSRSPTPPLAVAAAAALAEVTPHLPAAALAAAASVEDPASIPEGEVTGSGSQQQQQHDPGRNSLEQMLPALLPAPRWQYTGADYTVSNPDSNTDSNTPAAASGHTTPAPCSSSHLLPVAARAAAVSAGPVMVGAMQAAKDAAAVAAATLAAEGAFSADGGSSSRPCSATGRGRARGHSHSVDFSAFERQQTPELRRQVITHNSVDASFVCTLLKQA
jgi:hypothetical protein